MNSTENQSGLPADKAPGMSRNTRIILLVAIVILVGCLCTCGVLTVLRGIFAQQFSQWAEQNMTNDNAKVSQLAAGIASFDLPAGFSPAFGMTFFGTTLAGYQGPGQDSMIMLMQFPSGLKMDQASMEAQIRQAMSRQNSNASNTQMTIVDTRPVTIRGQDATLAISEGVTEKGVKIRQAMVFFPGDGGAAVVMIFSPAEEMDAASMEAFVKTIR
jgi:hypothetical protein